MEFDKYTFTKLSEEICENIRFFFDNQQFPVRLLTKKEDQGKIKKTKHEGPIHVKVEPNGTLKICGVNSITSWVVDSEKQLLILKTREILLDVENEFFIVIKYDNSLYFSKNVNFFRKI